MRKIFFILLVTILLLNGAGFYIYFYFRLTDIKREMRAEIARTSPELFQRITLTVKEYNLAKEGDDEIEWSGSMYDVASIKITGNTVEVLALEDRLETNFLSFASHLIQHSSSDSKTPPSALMQYLSLNFTIPSNQENTIERTFVVIKHSTIYKTAITDSTPAIVLPPPRS